LDDKLGKAHSKSKQEQFHLKIYQIWQ
jgi:hypothetical protein